MKFLLKILFVFSALFSKQIALGQTSGNWQLNERLFKIDYDENISYNYKVPYTQGLNFSTISDVKGELLFSFHNDSLFYNKNTPVKNGDGIYINYDSKYDDTFFIFSVAASYFIKINNNTFYYITNAYHLNFKTGSLLYTIIEKNKKNECEVTSKNNILKSGITSFLNINRNVDGTFGLVSRLSDYMYYYKISNGVFSLKDSFYINTKQGYADIMSTINKYGGSRLSLDMVMNSFGNSGYFYDLVEVGMGASFYNYCIKYVFLKLYRFDIDKSVDKFIGLKLIDSVRINSNDSQMNIPFFYELSILPNDSLLVLPMIFYNNTDCFSTIDKRVVDKSSFIIYDLYENSKSIIQPPTPNARSKVLPSGNLLWFGMYCSRFSKDSIVNFYYSIFTPEQLKNKANNVAVDSFYFPTNMKPGTYATGIDYSFQYISHHLFDYIRIVPEPYDYTCNTASIKLKNLTNKSNGINDFRFYVCKDSACNQVDSFKTFEPIITFPKNGKYPYKVYGYSPSQTGYGEWYEDTIVENIPPRPSADFVSSDSVVCRYKDVNFTNKSFTKDTSKLVGTNSHWYFANEKDSLIFGDNQDIKYAFTQTGIKEVKLIFSNGFCTDTFSQNIEVIDAPIPGFSINNLIGCTPFELIVNDTHTRFVKQKEYYNSFKNVWDTISLNQQNILYQFPISGNYYLIQKLVGANGCVIVRDTARIIIRPGITNQDSSQIYYASYLDNQNIEMIWNKTDAAKNYQLFSGKDGISFQNLAEVSDTFYTHNIKIPQVIYYQVSAIDSCGTASKISNFAKPIYLQTSLFGQNEKAIINYTPYEKLSQNIMSYNLYVLDTFGNTQQVFLSNSSTYNDENITDYDLSKICYQIIFPHPTILKEIKSNMDCINILPTIFVPNSFTPNNDGKNDEFYPSILGIESYDLYIYNRWGQMVGEYNKDKNWNGKDAPEGVYIYYIRARTSTGKIINGKGNISLLR